MSRPSEQTFSQTLPVEGLDPNAAALLQQQIDLGLKSLEQNNPDMAVTFFQSALNQSSFDFPFYDHLTHNLLLAYKQRIEQLIANEKKEEAAPLLAKALELELLGSFSADDKFCRAFADTFQSLGVIFFENYEFEKCLACYRRAIEIKPSPAYHVNLTNVLAVLRRAPLLSDFTTSLKPEQIGRHVFIACVPKSASTFLRNVLLGLTGYRDLFSVYSSWQTEQDLYLPSIVECAAENTVTQQHCRASEANIQMMQAFNIRPVILTRNIFDAIVSMADFYRQGAYFNSYFREGFMALDEEKQVDLLIDNIAPWYLQFTASWELAAKEDRLELHWLSYEDLTENKAGEIERLLEFYGLGAARAKIERLLSNIEAETRKNRFNKGVAGRGKTGLTDKQKERIIALTTYYPAADFTRIGL